MKALVIGAGPVGMVTACSIAKNGCFVQVLEIGLARKKSLQSGRIDFYEPELGETFQQYFQTGQIVVADSLFDALENDPEIIFVCVGTPSIEGSGETDLQYLWAFVDDFVRVLDSKKETSNQKSILLIIKSTVPVGTTKKIAEIIVQQAFASKVCVAFSPEFLRQGTALSDAQNPERVVFGKTGECHQICIDLFKQAVGALSDERFVITDSSSAELSKYAANVFLPMKITFANEIANFAKASGASSSDVLKIVGMDSRIGEQFLRPGPGFGGSCFPKDLASYSFQAKGLGVGSLLCDAVMTANERQTKMFIDKIIEYYDGCVYKDIVVAVFGLAFKPNTDDIRYSPGLEIARGLAKVFRCVYAYDPLVKDLDDPLVNLQDDYCTILEIADLIVLTTDDPKLVEIITEFNPNYQVIDCRNALPEDRDILRLV